MSDHSPASFAPIRHDDHDAPYREPLSRPMRVALLASVIVFHVGCGWALTLIPPTQIIVGDAPPMEVRMVSEEQPDINVPPPDDTPPPEPELESMIQPPPPDLPPPVFPVEAPPPPPPKPKPPPPRPKIPPRQTAEPVAPSPPAPAPAQPAGPRNVSVSQVSFRVRPATVYPAHARRMNEQGVVMLHVVVDTAGRPTNVTLAKSSGHQDLDEAALSAVRACQFNPYIEGGIAREIAVIVPINFVLQ